MRIFAVMFLVLPLCSTANTNFVPEVPDLIFGSDFTVDPFPTCWDNNRKYVGRDLEVNHVPSNTILSVNVSEHADRYVLVLNGEYMGVVESAVCLNDTFINLNLMSFVPNTRLGEVSITVDGNPPYCAIFGDC